MTSQSHTLPEDPEFAFCPAYDLENRPQQIRIVFSGMTGFVPTALVALSLKCCAQHLRLYVAVAGMLRWSGFLRSDRDLA